MTEEKTGSEEELLANAAATTASGEEAEEQAEELGRTLFTMTYKGSSQVIDQGEQGAAVAIFGDTTADGVRVRGKLKRPLAMREALSALYEIVKSDHRYVPKDRTAYLAHQRSRAGASTTAFQAQREYFEWLERNDPNAWLVLDPIITAHPDALLFEVFSKDEGSYACLSVDWDALSLDEEVRCGTTHIDFSALLYDSIKRMRSYRDTALHIGADAVTLQTGDAAPVIEKRIRVPNTWLRGMLQVQASATLPTTVIKLATIDLYNALRHLRLHADEKRGGRAIRIELMPGETPRLVLEPWEEVIPTTRAIYEGRTAQVIRIWGRRRWMMLTRLLPLADEVELHLLGTGLPSFCVLRCGALTFTLGLTGFTSANWSQALGLDTLLPRTAEADAELERLITHLKGCWSATAEELCTALSLSPQALRHAVTRGCQQGMLMFDLARQRYRLRPIAHDLDLNALEFRNSRERLAHDLIKGKGGKVKLLSTQHIPGVGVHYVADVAVKADRREYRCELTLDEEGRVKRVDDTSPFYRKHQLKEGPSAPLIALRLKIAEEQRARLEAREQGLITYETRTYVKRHERGEDVYQISLEEQRIRVKWGLRSMPRLRSQRLLFNSADAARHAYLERLRDLEARGYMDATAPM